jgi:hypothetical protein
MLPKSRMEDTRDIHQITYDNHNSYVGLGHILTNMILTYHLSSLMLYIGFYSIENGQRPIDDVRRIQ